jgi:hypothetical protein
MKVKLARHGGFAAGLNLGRPPKVVDADKLPKEAAAELSRLIAEAAAEKAPAKESAPAPDAMSYTITVENGERSTTLRQSDATMSPSFSALLNWLEARSDKQ